jgi:hypothetical protein
VPGTGAAIQSPDGIGSPGAASAICQLADQANRVRERRHDQIIVRFDRREVQLRGIEAAAVGHARELELHRLRSLGDAAGRGRRFVRLPPSQSR